MSVLTIETLTDAERRELELRFAWTISAKIIAKALRIIDAHATDRAALVEQVQLARAELECARRERDTWRSLCETAERERDGAAARSDTAEALVLLEARERASVAAREMSRCHRLWQEDAAKLVAANALLEECLIALFDMPHDPYHGLVARIRAHLSAQPAVLSDDLGDALAQVADAEHERAAPSLGHPGADEVFERLQTARKDAQPAAQPTAESDLAQLRARVEKAVSELEFSELADEYPTVGRALEALRGK